MHPLVELAKRTVEELARTGRKPGPPEPGSSLPEEFFNDRAGVFVCIKKQGDLRGCIGTFQPTSDNIAQETVRNAIAASTKDPRFSPIKEDELPLLTFSVDVLTAPEPVSSPDELDPGRYGVIVTSGLRRGLLLPDLDGVDTVEEQMSIAMMKARIEPDEDIKIERFEVRRYR